MITANDARSAQWVAKKFAQQDQRLAQVETTKPGLAQSSIESGAIQEFDAAGTHVGSYGTQFDGTHVAVSLAGPPPPAPAAPTVTPGPLSLTVRSSGKFVDDALSPMDFSHREVHVSTDPDAPAAPYSTTTLRGSLYSELVDELVISPLPNTTHYVWFVARSKSSKASEPSPATEGIPDAISSSTADGKMTVEPRPPLVEDGEGKPENALWNQIDGVSGGQVAVWRWDGAAWVDMPITETMLPLVNIAQGTYGKLQGVQLAANAVDGMVITAPIIQSVTAPNRGGKFTEDGLFAYNTTGTQTFSVDFHTGDTSFLGRIRAGSSIEGATIRGGNLEVGSMYVGTRSAANPSSGQGWFFNGSTGFTNVYNPAGTSFFSVDPENSVVNLWGGKLNVGNGGSIEGATFKTTPIPTPGLPGYESYVRVSNDGIFAASTNGSSGEYLLEINIAQNRALILGLDAPGLTKGGQAVIAGDSGWVNLPIKPGYAARGGSAFIPQGRKIGPMVFLRGQLDRSVGSWSGTTEPIDLPSWLAPSAEAQFPITDVTLPKGWIRNTGTCVFVGSSTGGFQNLITQYPV